MCLAQQLSFRSSTKEGCVKRLRLVQVGLLMCINFTRAVNVFKAGVCVKTDHSCLSLPAAFSMWARSAMATAFLAPPFKSST